MAKISIVVGSVYGNAEEVAQAAEKVFSKHQLSCAQVNDNTEGLYASEVLLVVCSTTGEGDLPDNIGPLYDALKREMPDFSGKQYGVIALGDSRFKNTFCMAGKKIEQLLVDLNAVSVKERLELDAKLVGEPEDKVNEWLNSFATDIA